MSILSTSPPSGLLNRLAHWAEKHPRNLALVYLADGEQEHERLDYGTLFERLNNLAAWLTRHVATGERALLAPHSEVHYLLGLLACIQSGIVAIPTLTTMNARALGRIQAHGEDAGACVLLADPWILERRDRAMGTMANAGSWLQQIPWLNMEEAVGRPEHTAAHRDTLRSPNDEASYPAYLQYTSGSTNRPKGVIVTSANLTAQLGSLERVFASQPGSVTCNWMPLFHDFGLIMSLQALYSGGTIVLLPAVPAVQRPLRWLKAISNYHAETSAATNFMFDRCVEHVTQVEREGLDLSGLRHLLNGAEPIQPSALRTFSKQFQSCGFEPLSWMPAYGLAEATLVAAMGTPGDSVVIEKFDANALLEQRVVEPNGAAKELVACGIPLVAGSVHIVDPESSIPSPLDAIGEVWLSSPSVTAGYWRRESESTETFGAQLSVPTDSRRFLRTGDLGFFWKGQLFIAGRLKDLVIVRGENHYPQDIELTVVQSHPFLEPNAGAAFAIDGADGECLVVVQEVRREVLQRIVPNELFKSIRHAVAEAHGLDTAHIILLRPVGLPRTSSGKVQRSACRQAWLDDALPVFAVWNGPSTALESAPDGIDRAAVVENKADSVELEILAICRRTVGNDQIDPTTSLFDYGVDSLKAVEILLALEERWNSGMDLADFATHSSVALLAGVIRERSIASPTVPREQPFVVGDRDEGGGSLPAAEELLTQVRHYVAAWEGERRAPDSLLVGRNTGGKNAPLFWVFQGQQEFTALADRLGPEQPVYGFRSGHQVMDYTEANIQTLATSYRREIAIAYPQGPIILGGNCQGGLIALAIAQQFWRLQQPIALVCLLEWAFPPQPYQGRVALLWGAASLHKNPFFKFRNPEHYWRRAYGAYSVDMVSGGHGEFFSGANLDDLANKLVTRMHEALAMPPLLLPTAANRASYRVKNPPAQLAPEQSYLLEVEVQNQGNSDWDATEQSGLQLGNHWLDSTRQVVSWLDGVLPLPTIAAGQVRTVALSIQAPSNPGTYLLQLDLVEEGVAWFSERGVTPLTLTIPVTIEMTK